MQFIIKKLFERQNTITLIKIIGKGNMNIKPTLKSLLKLQVENEVVEFKEAKYNYAFQKLGKYFSALSNEANLKRHLRAWLIFGVNNDRLGFS